MAMALAAATPLLRQLAPGLLAQGLFFNDVLLVILTQGHYFLLKKVVFLITLLYA
jgi:hypothetical protein